MGGAAARAPPSRGVRGSAAGWAVRPGSASQEGTELASHRVAPKPKALSSSSHSLGQPTRDLHLPAPGEPPSKQCEMGVLG